MIPAAGQFRARQTFLPEYIRRAIKLPQMDLEYTFWQMVPRPQHLCPTPCPHSLDRSYCVDAAPRARPRASQRDF